MLDIEGLRKEPEKVKENLARRGDPRVLELFERVRTADAGWREARAEADRLRRRRNEISQEAAQARKQGQDATKLLEEGKSVSDRLVALEQKEKEFEESRTKGLMRLPNLLDPTVPVGKDDSENQVVATWGEPKKLGFDGLPHAELAERLGIGDFDRGRRASGAGFYYLAGALAQLDLALQRFAIDQVVARGYTLMIPPYLLRRAPYEGVTDLTDFENVMYKVEGEDLYLIATSEHPLAAFHMGEILEEDILPLRLAGLSACFRKEIGGHGVDQKGVFRVHQFHKVEQFIFCRPEESAKLHEELLTNAQEIFRKLEIPYRVVNVCTGDIGTVAAKKYDIEGYFARQGAYREVVSCSNCTDYQARRLGIRMGKRGKPGKVVPHTLNSTAIATSRAMAVILENYQQPDGSVQVPKVLVPYLGGLKQIGPAPAAPH